MYVYLKRLGVDMDQELALENKLFYFEAKLVISMLGIVFCLENLSDLLWEKKNSSDQEKILRWGIC